ncbi:WD40 repeat domain-containing protein [Patulibacter americanus]|uniref:WD40 repeat domain-containing protein n=1 Tax=Patulibacter americanus TaxID=588672 RepID=UPI0003B4C473|nr:WD40 repeat domain-containing protein [Patulibacter americanus]
MSVQPDEVTVRAVASTDLDDWVGAVAWDPTGSVVAGACADGRVVTLAAADGAVREVGRHSEPATHVAWSPDGVLASTGQDGVVLLGDAGRVVLEGRGWPQALAWRPDGRRLAVARGRQVHLLDQDGATVGTSKPFPATVSSLAWSTRGGRLAAGTYGGVRMLQGDGLRTDRWLRWEGSVLAVAVSPDGRRLAHGNQDDSVLFWDLGGRNQLEMQGYETKVQELSWRADGRLLATGGGQAVTVWDFAGRGPAGSRPLELDHHEQPVSWVGFAPTGDLLATVAFDGRLVLWRPPHDRPVAGVEIEDALTCGAWSPDGRRLAVGGTDGTLAVVELA